jgi:hypothetical protein
LNAVRAPARITGVAFEIARRHKRISSFQYRHLPKCGKTDSIAWEEISSNGINVKEFVGVAGGFYERLRKEAPYPIELVCDSCGTVQEHEPLEP